MPHQDMWRSGIVLETFNKEEQLALLSQTYDFYRDGAWRTDGVRMRTVYGDGAVYGKGTVYGERDGERRRDGE